MHLGRAGMILVKVHLRRDTMELLPYPFYYLSVIVAVSVDGLVEPRVMGIDKERDNFHVEISDGRTTTFELGKIDITHPSTICGKRGD